MYLFMPEPQAIDLGAVTGSYECLNLVIPDKGHQR